ncbi:Hsp20/alpha crystallin family protein [Adhaeribacter aquaticus]|uniref:Hsp20/alpha crystallin family protein n=1 Tax=Adhaeribacter aquaticus TaxID=299567 RepID=UPI00047DFD48|nr:Hsp20/alpha crystallin family protein [Adhaeribacter aquaticus]
MGPLVKNNRSLFPGIPSFFDDMLTRDLFNWPMNHSNSNGNSVPAVNIKETNDAFELEVAAPGMSKQDFRIELDNNLLVISAHKEDKHEEQDEKGNYARREFSYQSFSRSFSLPERLVKGEEISAKYIDGVLHITVPKAEEAKVKPAKQIAIE